MKTSTCSKVVIGSCLNEGLIDHTSFHLIRNLASLPPAHVTIKDGTIVYDIPSSQIINGQADRRYYCDTDYEGMTADCRAIQSTRRESFSFNRHSTSFRAHKATIYDEEVNTDVFRIKRDAKHADVDVVTTEREVRFVYDHRDVLLTFQEVWTSPLANANADLFFGGPPYYTIIITLPHSTSTEYVRSLLTHIIPRDLLQDAPSNKP